MPKILINSVPHSGNHLVASVLQNLGLKHSVIAFTLYAGKPFLRRNQKAGINWRTARQMNNLGLRESDSSALVSVTNPVPVKLKVLEKIYKGIGTNEYLIGHMPHTDSSQTLLEACGLKAISVVRDPRDMVLSLLDHVKTRQQHLLHRFLFEELDTQKKRIKALLGAGEKRAENQVTIADMYDSMSRWAQSDNNLVVRFEDLVGGAGGGSLDQQVKAVSKIAHCAAPDSHLDENSIATIGENSFGKTTTFRAGRIARWKNQMDKEELELCAEYLTPILIELGYEDSEYWVSRWVHS